jgi:TIR domain
MAASNASSQANPIPHLSGQRYHAAFREEDTLMNAPKVFISYSHDSPEHKTWVIKLGSDLRAKGIDVVLDQWDLLPGQDMSMFMQRGISEANSVLMICSSKYVSKAETGSGGVGQERSIVTNETVRSIDTIKFIPILRKPLSPNFVTPRNENKGVCIMGRKPIGNRPMTSAERQRKWRMAPDTWDKSAKKIETAIETMIWIASQRGADTKPLMRLLSEFYAMLSPEENPKPLKWNDPVTKFAREMIVGNPGDAIPAVALFDWFKEWAQLHNAEMVSYEQFKRDLKNLGYSWGTLGGKGYFIGITCRSLSSKTIRRCWGDYFLER